MKEIHSVVPVCFFYKFVDSPVSVNVSKFIHLLKTVFNQNPYLFFLDLFDTDLYDIHWKWCLCKKDKPIMKYSTININSSFGDYDNAKGTQSFSMKRVSCFSLILIDN